MICYRWYVGHTDREGKPLFDRVRKCLQAAFKVYFPGQGYTLYRAAGYWEESSEETTIAELLLNKMMYPFPFHSEIPKLMAEHLAEVLNQSCVLLTTNSVDAKFVERKPING